MHTSYLHNVMKSLAMIIVNSYITCPCIVQGVRLLTPYTRLNSTPVCRFNVHLQWPMCQRLKGQEGKRQAKFKFTGYICICAHVYVCHTIEHVRILADHVTLAIS